MNDAAPVPRTDWDRVTAIAAVLIGLVAVLVAAYTAVLQREQVRAQVWPRLQLYNAGVAGEFRIANKGMGPAIVRWVRVEVDGKPVGGWKDAARRLGAPDPQLLYSSLSGLVLAPGDDIAYLVPSSRERFLAVRAHAGERLRLSLCYCSALDECWTTRNFGNSIDDVQRPVAQCPAADPNDFHD